MAVRERRGKFDVAVLAASAGGVTALRTVIRALPANFPVPVILVLHRRAGTPEMLSELLRARAALPVRTATPGLLHGGVTVLPAATTAELSPPGHLSLRPGTPNRIADEVLACAATAFGPRVLAVVLTGRLSDGADGVRAVKRAGGRVLVQDPDDAAAPGMPRAALATGCVEHALPLPLIAPALIAYAMAPGGPSCSPCRCRPGPGSARARESRHDLRHPRVVGTFPKPQGAAVPLRWPMSAPTGSSHPDPRHNLLLGCLPGHEYDRLLPALEPVELDVRDPIFDRGTAITHLYFPVDCVLSLVATAEDETAVEVATIGHEGMAGLPAFLGTPTSPNDCFCQIPGQALRLPVPDLQRFLSGDGALHDVLHRYIQATMVQLAQSVACNRLHTTEERCARWLLQTRDRVGADEFLLTQEFLAQMLGVRRGTVSLTAGVLQQAGIIRYTRGRMTVLDAAALHEAACDCYDIVQAEYRRLSGSPGS